MIRLIISGIMLTFGLTFLISIWAKAKSRSGETIESSFFMFSAVGIAGFITLILSYFIG